MQLLQRLLVEHLIVLLFLWFNLIPDEMGPVHNSEDMDVLVAFDRIDNYLAVSFALPGLHVLQVFLLEGGLVEV